MGRKKSNKLYKENEEKESSKDIKTKRSNDIDLCENSKRVKKNEEFEIVSECMNYENELILDKIRYYFGEKDTKEYIDEIFEKLTREDFPKVDKNNSLGI